MVRLTLYITLIKPIRLFNEFENEIILNKKVFFVSTLCTYINVTCIAMHTYIRNKTTSY